MSRPTIAELISHRLMLIHPVMVEYTHRNWSGMTLSGFYELADLVAEFVLSKKYHVAISGKRLVLAQELTKLYDKVPPAVRSTVVALSEKLCMSQQQAFELVDMHVIAAELVAQFESSNPKVTQWVEPQLFKKAQEQLVNIGSSVLDIGRMRREVDDLLRHQQFMGLEKDVRADLHSFVCNISRENTATLMKNSQRGKFEGKTPVFWLTFAFVKFYLDFCGEVEIQAAMKDLEPLKQGNTDTSSYQSPIWQKLLNIDVPAQPA